MIPLVFIDVETTGLEPNEYSIFQIAGIIKIGEEEESFNFRLRPYRGDHITEISQSKTGKTQEELLTYPDQKEAFISFKALLDKYNLGRSYKDKAYFIGYNSDFDMRFLRSWFEFNNDSRFGYYFWWPDLDVARLIALQTIGKRFLFKSFKLVDVYEGIFNEGFEGSHDAMEDIRATKRLFEYSAKKLLFPETREISLRPRRREENGRF